jgi:hypothetical protein
MYYYCITDNELNLVSSPMFVPSLGRWLSIAKFSPRCLVHGYSGSANVVLLLFFPRPAGGPFTRVGKLWRVSEVCFSARMTVKIYGYN